MEDAQKFADTLVRIMQMMLNDPSAVSANVVTDGAGGHTIKLSLPKEELELLNELPERTLRSLSVIAAALSEKSKSRISLDVTWQ